MSVLVLWEANVMLAGFTVSFYFLSLFYVLSGNWDGDGI